MSNTYENEENLSDILNMNVFSNSHLRLIYNRSRRPPGVTRLPNNFTREDVIQNIDNIFLRRRSYIRMSLNEIISTGFEGEPLEIGISILRQNRRLPPGAIIQQNNNNPENEENTQIQPNEDMHQENTPNQSSEDEDDDTPNQSSEDEDDDTTNQSSEDNDENENSFEFINYIPQERIFENNNQTPDDFFGNVYHTWFGNDRRGNSRIQIEHEDFHQCVQLATMFINRIISEDPTAVFSTGPTNAETRYVFSNLFRFLKINLLSSIKVLPENGDDDQATRYYFIGQKIQVNNITKHSFNLGTIRQEELPFKITQPSEQTLQAISNRRLLDEVPEYDENWVFTYDNNESDEEEDDDDRRRRQ